MHGSDCNLREIIQPAVYESGAKVLQQDLRLLKEIMFAGNKQAS